MLIEIWNKLPVIWKFLAYKNWLLFIDQQFSLQIFLWDDSYGLDFILCKELNIQSGNIEDDLKYLENIVIEGIKNPSCRILDEIFSMQFLSISSDITFLSPLKNFPNIRVLDFHGQNESKINDFEILHKSDPVYVLDYSDYIMIDFDKYSNIRHIDNINYIKGFGFPCEINLIISGLNKKYNIHE